MCPGPSRGKCPLGNRLYHSAIVVAGLSAVATGVLMMSRVRTPFFTRDPYLFSDRTWGATYVLHGVAGVGLVGLVIAHVCSSQSGRTNGGSPSQMIFGWITRRQYSSITGRSLARRGRPADNPQLTDDMTSSSAGSLAIGAWRRWQSHASRRGATPSEEAYEFSAGVRRAGTSKRRRERVRAARSASSCAGVMQRSRIWGTPLRTA